MNPLTATITHTALEDDGSWTLTVAVTDGNQAADFAFNVTDTKMQQLLRRGVTLELKPKATA